MALYQSVCLLAVKYSERGNSMGKMTMKMDTIEYGEKIKINVRGGIVKRFRGRRGKIGFQFFIILVGDFEVLKFYYAM